MRKSVIISTILFLLVAFVLNTPSLAKNNCGESCIRRPQKRVEGSLNIHSKKSNGKYFKTYTVSAEKGAIITVHLYSEDFTTHLKLYYRETLLSEKSTTEPDYIYPGEIPYWEASVISTASSSGTYTLVVTTTEEGDEGAFTIDWTVGDEEQLDCSPVSCDLVI